MWEFIPAVVVQKFFRLIDVHGPPCIYMCAVFVFAMDCVNFTLN